jgi:hypothetical protein
VLIRLHKRSTTRDSTQKQFISSQAFHRTLGERVRETAAGEQSRPQIFETLDTVAQQHTGDSTCNKFHTQPPCNTPIAAHNRSLLGTDPEPGLQAVLHNRGTQNGLSTSAGRPYTNQALAHAKSTKSTNPFQIQRRERRTSRNRNQTAAR